jgi:molybdopterin-guanine dinucleotide biosynthesis protein A
MGRDKATLPFGRETLLQRVVRRVGEAVEEVVVVARPGQELPPLPGSVRIARDEVLDQGPLGGLAPGLAASGADAVYATACDVPFLEAAVVDLLFERLGDADAVVPEAEGHLHPLAAVYRVRVRPLVEELLASGRLRPAFLFDRVPTVRVGEDDLRAVDPDLSTLENLNTPEAYEAARRALAPTVRVELFETARRLAGAAVLEVEASTLGEALAEVAGRFPALRSAVVVPEGPRRARLAPTWRASVGGRTFVVDPSTPLAEGDSVLLVSSLAGG